MQLSGAEGDGAPPRASFFPAVEDFIGEGGTLDWPEVVVSPAARRGAGRDDPGRL